MIANCFGIEIFEECYWEGACADNCIEILVNSFLELFRSVHKSIIEILYTEKN